MLFSGIMARHIDQSFFYRRAVGSGYAKPALVSFEAICVNTS